MISLYLVTLGLLAVGGTVVTLQVLRKPSPFPFLVSRRVDPHLWGFHFLGAGSLLSLVLWILARNPWRELVVPGRLALLAALLWTIVSLSISLAALLRPRREGTEPALIPSAHAKFREWPGLYRAFLFLGFVTLGMLALFAF